MKKTILLSSAFIIAAIIFTSCGTNGVSLTKRHYRSGYNLEISSSKTKSDSKTEKAEEKQVSTQTAKSITEASVEPEYASIGSTNENNYVKHKPFTFDKKDVAPVTSETITAPAKKKSFIGNGVKQIASSAKATSVKSSLSKAFKAPSDGSLGGLLWTIAGILLVIWLISLLTGGWGLGGFLHLFLVIALVLILLRLFHVL